jgi:membrane associated rhomboid family serine protease
LGRNRGVLRQGSCVGPYVLTVFSLLIVAGLGYYLTTPAERARLAQRGWAAGLRLRDAAMSRSPASAPLRDALRARTRRPVVTPAILVVNAAVFLLMLVGPGALGHADTLVGWGANVASRTTNGEWWRLVTMLFVHAGPLHLIATVAGLVPLGLMLERLVGSLAFATAFFGAGILAAIVSLSTSAVAVSAGGSGAIFGLYGLLSASVIWGAIANPSVPIPVATVNRVVAPAAVFVLYNLANDSTAIAGEMAGFAAGFVGGLVLARGVIQYRPPVRRSVVISVATVVLAVGAAVPLRGTGDIRSDIERVVVLEGDTAGAYDAAVDRFRSGQATAASLARLIEGTIVPELQAVRGHLKAVERVPREQLPLVAAADEYLALREKAWRMRADALRESSMPALREADRAERASLDAFRRIRSVKGPRTGQKGP